MDDPKFQQSVKQITETKKKVSQKDMLRLYGLYKFVTVGWSDPKSRPGVFNLKGRAKHDAWVSVSNDYGESENGVHHAAGEYVDLVNSII